MRSLDSSEIRQDLKSFRKNAAEFIGDRSGLEELKDLSFGRRSPNDDYAFDIDQKHKNLKAKTAGHKSQRDEGELSHTQ